MIIKTISATYNRKFNLGNYNSAEIGVTMWADVRTDDDEAEDPLAATTELMSNCRDHVKAEAQALYLSITQARRLGTDVKPTETAKSLTEFQGEQ